MTSTCKPVAVLVQGISAHFEWSSTPPLSKHNQLNVNEKPGEGGEMNHTLKQKTPIV